MPTSLSRPVPTARDRLRWALLWGIVLVAAAVVVAQVADYRIVVGAESDSGASDG